MIEMWLALIAAQSVAGDAGAALSVAASDPCAPPADLQQSSALAPAEAPDLNPWRQSIENELIIFDIPLNSQAEVKQARKDSLFLRLFVDPETGEALISPDLGECRKNDSGLE
ncbi:MAG: hypothetical protein AAGD92_05145 [Pseudomonadota bacterium]